MGRLVTARRVAVKALVALLAALVLAAGCGLPSPEPAFAQPVEVDGKFVHDGLEGDAAEMNGKTWEEVRDGRYHDEDASAEDWDNRPLGGMTYPGFDIMNPLISISHQIYIWIEGLVGGLVGVCNSLFGELTTNDSLTLEMDNPTFGSIYSASVAISEQIVQPVALGFLGLALVLEFLQFSKETITTNDHYRLFGGYLWILVKFAALATIIGHTVLVTNAIYGLFLSVTKAIMALLTSVGAAGAFDSIMITLQEVTYADFGHVLLLLIVAFVMVVAVAITVVRVLVLTVTRMFEIYVLAAFSGIPLVMLASRQARDSGLRYFKLFAGACAQATVLVVMLAFAGTIMSAVSVLLEVSDTSFAGMIINIIAPIAGVFGVNAVIGMSREISNRILGA